MNVNFGTPAKYRQPQSRALPVRFARAVIPQSARTRLKAHAFLRTNPDGCIFVHVGKCGGTTLLDAFQKEPQNKAFYVHMVRPPVIPGARYALALRNPLSRFVSAFNHHQRSHELGQPERGDPNSIEWLFDTYDNVSTLADDLYAADGTLNQPLLRCLSKVGHLHRGIDFYLAPLLRRLDRIEIGPVFVQERLEADIARHLGDANPEHERFAGARHWRESLTDASAEKLARYLDADFTCLETLARHGALNDAQARLLLEAPRGTSHGQFP